MTESLAYRLMRRDNGHDTSMLAMLVEELIVDAIDWRVGLVAGPVGPTVGATTQADVTYDPSEVVVLIPMLIDDALIRDEASAEQVLGEDQDIAHDVLAGESTGGDPWAWLRSVTAGRVGGPDAERVLEVLEPGYDRRGGIQEVDAVVSKIIRHWAAEPHGCSRIALWASDRETARRADARRLDGLRRRYDRDLLLMADRLSGIAPGR